MADWLVFVAEFTASRNVVGMIRHDGTWPKMSGYKRLQIYIYILYIYNIYNIYIIYNIRYKI